MVYLGTWTLSELLYQQLPDLHTFESGLAAQVLAALHRVVVPGRLVVCRPGSATEALGQDADVLKHAQIPSNRAYV